MLHNKTVLAIVDDHPIVIEGLKALLKDDANIDTLSFTRGNDFIDFIQKNTVDIVLLDIMLPDANGIDLCKDIKKNSPQTIVLGLSNQAERSIILQMLQNGASGYLLKNAAAQELLQCIAEAQNGGIAFSKEVKEIMSKPSRHHLQNFPTLTKREKQILQLITDGKTSQEIAELLFLSLLTIETHRRNLMQKLQVKNVAGLIKIATENRLL